MTREAEALFELALNYFRAPRQYQQQLGLLQPGAQGFSGFLELANKSAASDATTSIAGALHATPDELLQAAISLIRQVLFSGADDHYHVLGIEQDASLEEIKKRYRLLIRLFHPDRNPEGSESTRLYAPRLNEAYNILKKPARRRAYDEQLRSGMLRQDKGPPANASAASRPVSMSGKRRGASGAHFKTTPVDWLYRLTFRHRHPKLMVWGCAMVFFSIILVFLYYNSSSPVLQLSNEPLPKPGDRPASVQKTDSAYLDDAREAFQFALSRAETKEAPPVAAADTGAGNFNEAGMESFLARYTSAYVSGDLEQMMSLFTTRVRTDTGEGIAVIEKDYGNLFHSTDRRRMQIRNVQWDKMNEHEVTMQFHADIQVRSERFQDWQFYAGTMNLLIVDRDNRLLISEIRHSIREKEM
jgi:curved DNA-binding protein CbpA